ncbi:MAG: hypothetical protein H6617_04550 [Bdellovibrionaceae bacterium]|nr:hypothetical protein [Pseudobdellovibrionaceae bacterium]
MGLRDDDGLRFSSMRRDSARVEQWNQVVGTGQAFEMKPKHWLELTAKDTATRKSLGGSAFLKALRILQTTNGTEKAAAEASAQVEEPAGPT